MAGVSHPLFGARPHPGDGRGRPLGSAAGARAAENIARSGWCPQPSSARWRSASPRRLPALPLPFVEPVILASVVVIGLLAAVALNVPDRRLPWRWSASSPSSTAMRMAANSARPARSPSASASRFPPRCCTLPALGLGSGSAAPSAATQAVCVTRLAGGATALGRALAGVRSIGEHHDPGRNHHRRRRHRAQQGRARP